MLLNAPRAAGIMKDLAFDALLASTLQNVFYLSGFWNENFLITPRSVQTFALVLREDLGTPSLVAGVGDAAAIMTACPPQSQVTYYGTFFRYVAPAVELDPLERRLAGGMAPDRVEGNSVDALIGAFQRRGLTQGTVGYEERGMPAVVLDGLRAALPRVELRPADAAFQRIRAVKTAAEINRLHDAVRLTEDAVRAAIALARPGVSEAEMVREFERTIVGGGGRPYFTQIYFGRRGSVGQQPFLTGVLRRGDIIRFDVGCVLRGYCSDIARNVALGDPGERLRRLHAVTVQAEDEALAALRPGATASDVFRAGEDAGRRGIADFRRTHVGHAIGMEVYEPPLLGPNDHTIIEEGMVFEVETPYYEIGTAGLQPEDTVVVTQGEPRVLMTLPRDLIVVD
jgi:Xaa-Pro aminopeptidase